VHADFFRQWLYCLFCGKTNAEATVTGVLAPASVDDSLGILHRNMIEIEEEDLTPYFSITSDASNHGSSKMFPVAIKFWTPQDGMHNRVLDFYSDSEESAGATVNQLTSRLEKMDCQFRRCQHSLRIIQVLIMESIHQCSRIFKR
jgi:hypothetical protein